MDADPLIELSNNINALWSGLGDEGPHDAHCPEESLHRYISGAPDESILRSVRWTALLSEADPSMDWLERVWFRDPSYWPPDGTSPEAYGRHVLAMMEAWLDDWRAFPQLPIAPYQQPPVLTWSRFDGGQEVAERAVSAVLGANADVVRPWLEAPGDGWDRLHLYTDLAEQLGPIGTAAVRRPEEKEPTMVRGLTGCAVIIRRRRWGVGGQDNLVVVDSYPERPLEFAWRARYPDLVHAFGGYFHQTSGGNGAFVPQRQFMLDTVGPARERVKEQLTHLLFSTTDDELEAALAAFGCHMRPYPHPVARLWLQRWLWRMDGLPWDRRAANSWADRGGLELS